MPNARQRRSAGDFILRRVAEEDNFIPHPAPNTPGYEGDSSTSSGATMGALSVLKTLVIPAIISLILYLLISFLIVPIWKRYRGRYSQYLPLDTITTHTTTLRERVQDALVRWLLPSSWRRDFGGGNYTVNAQDGSGSDFDEDEGEELYEVDEHRREALSLDARRGRDDVGRRLSRDLEEGFKDDSSDEEDEDERQGRTLTRL